MHHIKGLRFDEIIAYVIIESNLDVSSSTIFDNTEKRLVLTDGEFLEDLTDEFLLFGKVLFVDTLGGVNEESDVKTLNVDTSDVQCWERRNKILLGEIQSLFSY